LQTLGLDKNTVIVLWGDHGWHLGDHGMWCKHTNYEQATRIPVIVVAPGCGQGVRTKALIESVDLYPTLCELAGIQAPAERDGQSIVKTLHDISAPTKNYILHAYPRSSPQRGPMIGRAIRDSRYRLVEWKKIGTPAETAELELYDYVEDPLETRNVAAAELDVAARLHSILKNMPEAKPQITSKKN
jgi:iduronate 2-sulfatase